MISTIKIVIKEYQFAPVRILQWAEKAMDLSEQYMLARIGKQIVHFLEA
jgi:hypothetical protein